MPWFEFKAECLSNSTHSQRLEVLCNDTAEFLSVLNMWNRQGQGRWLFYSPCDLVALEHGKVCRQREYIPFKENCDDQQQIQL